MRASVSRLGVERGSRHDLSGVSGNEVKVTYLAVVYGGPRWDQQTIDNSRLLVDLKSPSQRPPRQRYLNGADIDLSRGPIRLNPPDAKTRFQDMATQVREHHLSLDQIDRLADTDAEKVHTVISSPDD